MDQRVSLVTLGVSDLKRSRQFYEDGLGWQPATVLDEVVFYQLGGMVLGLYGRDALAKDAHMSSQGSGFGGIALAYNTRGRDEVDAAMAEAEAAGATVLKPAEDAFWGGYSGYFADPDGHVWEVAWNPFWTIADDGSIILESDA